MRAATFGLDGRGDRVRRWSDRGELFSGGGVGVDDTARLTPGRDPARIPTWCCPTVW